MKFGSLFSGIEAASAAWLPLGWRCAWVAEIDPFACAVLKHHYPDTPNLGDVNRIDPDAVEPVDLVIFGSPCQSFSVAGKRLGLDDPRGNMALVGLRLIGKLRPRWVVWENVPGVLSSDQGRDFGAFLGLLGELGYGFAYRVLDAQHFGVPQRRRRVFVVGCLGDWRRAAAVLFEPESLRGDPAPRRQAGENATAGAGDGSAYSCRPASRDAAWRGDGADNFYAPEVAYALSAGAQDRGGVFGSGRDGQDTFVADIARCVATGSNAQRYDYETETLIATDYTNGSLGDVCGTLEAAQSKGNRGHGVIAFSAKDHGADAGDTAPTLRAGGHATSHANAGVMPAIAHYQDSQYGCAEYDTAAVRAGRIPEHSMVVTHTLRADGFDASEDGTGRGTPLVPIDMRQASRGDKLTNYRAHGSGGAPGHGVGEDGDPAYTVSERGQAVMTLAIRRRGDSHDLEYREDGIANAVPTPNGGRAGIGAPLVCGTIGAESVRHTNGLKSEADLVVPAGMSVRRLTPGECLKLQGFPPDYLDIQYRGKPAADGNRYRAIGNSMAVPVVRWIGQRIRLVDDTITELSDAAE